ncbi:hypothetical protein EST38_g10392 [Candolleomyces aberdarensis]|uniref:Ornithine cyclodeaminase n=1 Tax=Candolleomyces aberdarensis TaxID=2316362 RepID=A0A4Q2D951_9AGAR|nr:hypothetical protein EST38_g10392 [Candolleomyces aberdarensis]
MSLRVLSGTDVERISSNFEPTELQCLMAQVFDAVTSLASTLSPKNSPMAGRSNTPRSTTQTPHRTTISTENHHVLFMPARMAADTAEYSDSGVRASGTSVKIVSVPKSSSPGGLPATTLVLDEHNGSVKAMVNARKLTALRNAAGQLIYLFTFKSMLDLPNTGSLLSTSLAFTNGTPRRIVAFGAGNQIEAHVNLYLRFFHGIQNCTIVNRTANDRFKFLVQRLSSSFPQVQFTPLENLSAAAEVEEEVSSADVIICATSSAIPLFPSRWVRAGTQIVLVGSYTPEMQEIDTDLVKRATLPHFQGRESNAKPLLVVDSWDACSKEAGELIKANLSRDDVRELGEMLPRDSSGRLDLDHLNTLLLSKQATEPLDIDRQPDFTGPVTIFKSVGIGLQDVAIASAVVQKAEELGIGTVVDGYDD